MPTVERVDVAFVPDELTIPADTDVTVSLPNTGAATHDFTIDDLGIHVVARSGETGSVTINAAAGRHEYYCSIPGHKQGGMVGALLVEQQARGPVLAEAGDAGGGLPVGCPIVR